MKLYAILDDDRNVIPVDNYADTLPMWNDSSKRIVEQETLPNGIRISTVFLCINHGHDGGDLWFETLIMGGPDDGYIYRYETWKEAERGHIRQKSRWVSWKPPKVSSYWTVEHDNHTLTILKKKPGLVSRFWYWLTGKKVAQVRLPKQEL